MKIAMHYLSPGAKSEVSKILLSYPCDKNLYVYPEVTSVWQDNTKPMEIYDHMCFSNTYVINEDGIDLKLLASSPLERYYQTPIQVIPDIVKTLEEMEKRKSYGYNDVNVAYESALLRMLVHIVADLHQPYHVTELAYKHYIDKKNPFGLTKGANLIKCKLSTRLRRQLRQRYNELNIPHVSDIIEEYRSINLHKIWDTVGLYADEFYVSNQNCSTIKSSIPTNTEDMFNAYQCFFLNDSDDFVSNLPSESSLGDVNTDYDVKMWAEEVRGYVSNDQYLGRYVTDQVHSSENQGIKKILINAQYLDEVRNLTKKLLVVAGMRLGHLLSMIFDNQGTDRQQSDANISQAPYDYESPQIDQYRQK